MPTVPPAPSADESGFVLVNGIRMYYAIFNKRGGNPVILLHGGLGSSDDWGFEMPRLARTHEVIVFDSRERGRSTLSWQAMSYDLLASDVLGLMDDLKIARASIVGASDGGIIGLILAIHHPDRIDNLFAFGANFSRSVHTSTPPNSAMAARYLAKAKADDRFDRAIVELLDAGR